MFATVKINGVKKKLETGIYSFPELINALGLRASTTQIVVSVTAPAQASTINGNDSFQIIGGESFSG